MRRKERILVQLKLFFLRCLVNIDHGEWSILTTLAKCL